MPNSNFNGKEFKPKRKNAAAVHNDAELCSYTSDEAEKLCLHSSSDTYRDNLSIKPYKIRIYALIMPPICHPNLKTSKNDIKRAEHVELIAVKPSFSKYMLLLRGSGRSKLFKQFNRLFTHFFSIMYICL